MTETYRDFYIESEIGYYLATSYAPRHLIRSPNLDELKKKIDDYLEHRE